jgi:hypothetical protein
VFFPSCCRHIELLNGSGVETVEKRGGRFGTAIYLWMPARSIPRSFAVHSERAVSISICRGAKSYGVAENAESGQFLWDEFDYWDASRIYSHKCDLKFLEKSSSSVAGLCKVA